MFIVCLALIIFNHVLHIVYSGLIMFCTLSILINSNFILFYCLIGKDCVYLNERTVFSYPGNPPQVLGEKLGLFIIHWHIMSTRLHALTQPLYFKAIGAPKLLKYVIQGE